jgi:hypothetical protein
MFLSVHWGFQFKFVITFNNSSQTSSICEILSNHVLWFHLLMLHFAPKKFNWTDSFRIYLHL